MSDSAPGPDESGQGGAAPTGSDRIILPIPEGADTVDDRRQTERRAGKARREKPEGDAIAPTEISPALVHVKDPGQVKKRKDRRKREAAAKSSRRRLGALSRLAPGLVIFLLAAILAVLIAIGWRAEVHARDAAAMELLQLRAQQETNANLDANRRQEQIGRSAVIDIALAMADRGPE